MKASSLYRAFHGAAPKSRKVSYEHPIPPLVAIGIITEICYRTYGSSRRNGTYHHEMGDTGVKKLGSNSILCTDSKGKSLFIVKISNKSKLPFFSSRGVIG